MIQRGNNGCRKCLEHSKDTYTTSSYELKVKSFHPIGYVLGCVWLALKFNENIGQDTVVYCFGF